MWFPRGLLGIESHLLAFYDHPALMHRLNADLAAFSIRVADAVCQVLVPDMIGFAEDMSYNHGPMLSRACFDEFLLPNSPRVVPRLKRRGLKVLVDVVWIREPFPHFLMLGGYDKRVMSKGEAALRVEFERLLPVVRSGGYIPSGGHQTPPEVSLASFRTYVRLLRESAHRAAQ